MRVIASSMRRQSTDPTELTMSERVTLALELGGRRVQDLVVTFGVSRTDAKRLLKLRDQLGRSCSPCMLAALAGIPG
jgi:hypothetical protein